MLENVNLLKTLVEEEYDTVIDGLRGTLANLQQKIKQEQIPVIILFEGWGASGKGSMISDIILNMDPRLFNVFSIDAPYLEETRKPNLCRFWSKIPAKGEISIFDRSWYRMLNAENIDRHDYGMKKSIRSAVNNDIITFEKQLTDSGYVIIKIFLHISKKEQKKRFNKLLDSEETKWRVTQRDLENHKHYEQLYSLFNTMLEDTDKACAKWNVISSEQRKSSVVDVYNVIINALESVIANKEDRKDPEHCLPKFNLVQTPKLDDIDLDVSLEREEYKKALKKEQKKLKQLHNILYLNKIPVIICYEGWDAAGKGGNIKRIARALDPRGYEVVPIGAPTKDELNHHYLWRFWGKLPKTGHITIFDRTWYGRVLVERVESLCSVEQWSQAYTQINEFENQLTNWGAIVVKLWLHIDKDEQLTRFKDRQNNPDKLWKITDEDWRNREKWDLYYQAVDDMIHRTSTDFAPWNIVESNDKPFARLKTIRIIIDAITRQLDL